MQTYTFENRGQTPLYICLYEDIKADILKGKLLSDSKLPSKRNLAEHLKLSVVTVENAYAQLILEGYIYSVEKKGYFVNKVQAVLKTENILPLNENSYDKKTTHLLYADFKSNNISSGKFPFSVWAKLMRETLTEQDALLLESIPYNGIEQLRKAIAEHLYHFRGMSVNENQIVIGAGTEYLYSLIIQLLGKDRTFAIEDPGYKKISKVYQSNGVLCRFIGMDTSGLSLLELKKSDSDVVHISPAHHFPTGIVMPIKRRHELLSWAGEQEERYIIEDDYDSEFRFSGKPVQTLQSIDTNQKVIYVNTFTKSIAPSIRISYMVLPPKLMERYISKMNFYSCTVSGFEQITLAKFISKGYFERHINRMRNYYKKLRDKVILTLKCSSLGSRLSILEENSGLHFLLKVKTDMADADISNAAEKAGIKISFLSEYYNDINRSVSGTMIINYSGLEYEKAEQAINLLIKIFE